MHVQLFSKIEHLYIENASWPWLSNVCGQLRIAHQKIILDALIFYVYRSPLFISQAFQSSLLMNTAVINN